MKRIALIIVSLSLGLTACLRAQTDNIFDQHRVADAQAIKVVAHRADWRSFPENSIPAIEGSIAMGLPMAEIDIRRTRDGQFVLMHDDTVDRTTTGRGRVADLTMTEIRELRLRDGLGSPTEFRVPTLREALLVARGRILLNLDKSYGYFREMMPVLAETAMLGQVVMKGSAPVEEVRAQYGDLLSRVAYMPVIRFREPEALVRTLAWLEKGKPCAVEFVFPQWTNEVAEAFALCRERGVRIWVSTLWPQLAGGLSDDLALSDPAAVYGVMIDRGVSIIQTDRPRELLAYLQSRRPRNP